MKKTYRFIVLILFISVSLASNNEEEGYEDLKLFRERGWLPESCYYDPAAKDPFSQASQSRVLAAIERPTEEDSDDREFSKVVASLAALIYTRETLDKPLEEKTLFDFLNDTDSEKALNFFKTGIPYETHTLHMSTLIHLSQFVKNNDLETILALTSFLDIAFHPSNLKCFNLEAFKERWLGCKTPQSQKKVIEREKRRLQTIREEKLKKISSILRN